jgi:hypothetical protein
MHPLFRLDLVSSKRLVPGGGCEVADAGGAVYYPPFVAMAVIPARCDARTGDAQRP